MRHTSAYWIKKLELEKHPEGGYFKEVYRSGEFIEKSALPKRFIGKRCFGTSIYFLLKKENISAFHMICSDETWHFYYGDTVYINIIDKTGNLNRVKLGNEPSKREVLQYTVPAGAWFAASISVDNKNNRYSYCLVGCTVAPGFDFSDFKMGERDKLLKKYPQHKEIIISHTY